MPPIKYVFIAERIGKAMNCSNSYEFRQIDFGPLHLLPNQHPESIFISIKPHLMALA